MYQNVLKLLDAIQNNKFYFDSDFNINEDHLKEFYSNHNNTFEIHLIKLYLMILNKKTEDIETIKYVANYIKNGNYQYLYLIKKILSTIHYL
jgi:hypothetical protein